MSTFTAFPVKGGDAFFLQKGEKNILVDGGRLKNEINTYLVNEGISKIDVVICTHNDNDHTTGIIGLLDNNKINISELWLPASWAYRLTSDDPNFDKELEEDIISSIGKKSIDICIFPPLHPDSWIQRLSSTDNKISNDDITSLINNEINDSQISNNQKDELTNHNLPNLLGDISIIDKELLENKIIKINKIESELGKVKNLSHELFNNYPKIIKLIDYLITIVENNQIFFKDFIYPLGNKSNTTNEHNIHETNYNFMQNENIDFLKNNQKKFIKHYINFFNYHQYSCHSFIKYTIDKIKDIIDMKNNIFDIFNKAKRKVKKIRYFEYNTTDFRGGEKWLKPINSREILKVSIKPDLSPLRYLYLSSANKESLMFYSPEDNNDGSNVIFTADSVFYNLNITKLKKQLSSIFINSKSIIITAPHHGSEANDTVYDFLEKERIYENIYHTIWVRSDGPSVIYYDIRPCERYKKLSKKYCTRCNITTTKYTPKFKLVSGYWQEINGTPMCQCK